MVFSGSALMKHDPSVLIANDNGDGSVPQSISMRIKFGSRSDYDIILVN
jgi:hypothetical protein